MNKSPIRSLEDFEAKYKEICLDINTVLDGCEIITNNWVTFDRTPKGDATPNIEYIYGKFYYVISERGSELERIGSDDPYDIMYLLFQYITFSIASNYEVQNRAKNQDTRRLLFKKQIDLLQKISKEWAEKRDLEYKSILEKYPYID
jgi:hypothetical protein